MIGRTHRLGARSTTVVVATLLAIVVGLATGAGTAHAHTDFVGSAPADGEVADGPLTEIRLEFTNPAEPSGDGFRLLDPTGAVRQPSSVDPTDGTVFVLGFDPPLADGTHAVSWEVRAGDAHPIDGTFRFEVIGAPSTTVPPTTAAADTGGAAAPPATTVAPTTTVAAITLDEFLDDGSSSGASSAPAARLLGYGGTILALGIVAALLWVVRGRRDELTSLVAWLRLCGIVIAVGGVLAIASLQADLDESLGEVLGSEAGVSGILQLVGGLAIWFGFGAAAGSIVAAPRSLSSATAEDASAPPRQATEPFREHRWEPTSSSVVGLAAVGLVVAAGWFDGHQATRGPRIVHAAVDTVHVLAAGCWAGTVVVMALVAWRRRRDGPGGVAAMVGRFALPATISLVAVAVAGVAMMLMITDDLGELTSTDWGRLYLAKVAAVAVAAGLGGYHRFRVHPLLAASDSDPGVARTARRLLMVEAAVMVGIVGITAWLVAASI